MSWFIKIKTNENTDCYVSDGHGDPSRTHFINYAKKYENLKKANRALKTLRKKYPNREFEIA